MPKVLSRPRFCKPNLQSAEEQHGESITLRLVGGRDEIKCRERTVGRYVVVLTRKICTCIKLLKITINTESVG